MEAPVRSSRSGQKPTDDPRMGTSRVLVVDRRFKKFIVGETRVSARTLDDGRNGRKVTL